MNISSIILSDLYEDFFSALDYAPLYFYRLPDTNIGQGFGGAKPQWSLRPLKQILFKISS